MKKVLLIGNPNVGKTALINRLSGSSYSIGNWSGVTVAKQEAIIQCDIHKIQIVDVPGIYSLSPSSEDEKISSKIIFSEEYDLIINVIDIHHIQKNLMLTMELMELGIPMISVLNFYDEFEKTNVIDLLKLQENLNFPIFPISARTGYGFDKLKEYLALPESYEHWIPENPVSQNSQLDAILEKIMVRYPLAGFSARIRKSFIQDQIAIKNKAILEKLALTGQEVSQLLKQHDFSSTIMFDLMNKRLQYFQDISIQKIQGKSSVSEISKKIDRVLLHGFWGYSFFLGIMTLLFTMVFNASGPLIDFVDWLINDRFYLYISKLISNTAPEIQSFILDGIISGVGGILTFVPLIFILYLFLAFVEESGYFSRIAFLLEYPMSKVGLSGKSFFSLMIGLGCTVPAIYSTRTIENPSVRRLTSIVSSLMSCGARLPVYALFVAAFFSKNSGLILMSIYLSGVLFMIFLSWILSRFKQFSPSTNTFVLVLPPYRLPSLPTLFKTANYHAKSYIKKASGIILGLLMIIWVFSYFPARGDIKKSYIAQAGNNIQHLFVPLGFGDRWEIVVSIIPSLIAKEAVIGFLGQVLNEEFSSEEESSEEAPLTIFGEVTQISTQFFSSIQQSLIGLVSWNIFDVLSPPPAEDLEEEGGSGIIQRLSNVWTDQHATKKAYSFLLFILFTLPCVTAIGALKQELEWPYFLLAMSLYCIIPFLISFLFFQIAILF